MSRWTPSLSPWTKIGSVWSRPFARLRCWTNSTIPPAYAKTDSLGFSERSSRRRIVTPLLRNASSRRPLGERVVAELDRLEDLGIGREPDLRSARAHRAGDDGSDLTELGRGLSALVGLLVDLPLAPDLELEGLGQGVDHRDADAVQAARDLVGVVLELAARVELRHDDLGGGLPLLLVQVRGDAAAVVDDGDGVVPVDRDIDPVAEPGLGLVDRVVHDFVDEVVKPERRCRADVHRGALANRFEPLEDLDLARVVVPHRLGLRLGPHRLGLRLGRLGCLVLGQIHDSPMRT
jgi:hypothetical protein